MPYISLCSLLNFIRDTQGKSVNILSGTYILNLSISCKQVFVIDNILHQGIYELRAQGQNFHFFKQVLT
jgi:hypothetical protein